jgi:hypothetical protein
MYEIAAVTKLGNMRNSKNISVWVYAILVCYREHLKEGTSAAAQKQRASNETLLRTAPSETPKAP